MNHTEWRRLLRQFEAQGWTVSPTRGGHYRLRHERTGVFMHASSSPGDGRTLANLRARAKRLLRDRLEKA